MNGMNSKKAGGKKSHPWFAGEAENDQIDQEGGYNVKENIRNVVADRIESGKLIVNGKADSPKGSVGNVSYPWGKAGRNFFYTLNGRIVKNKWNVIKYKLIIKAVEVNNWTKENQTDN